MPLILADLSDAVSLDAMAARSRLVLNAIGPYSKYGLPVVEACAAAGTDYADLTGEVPFVRRSIDRCHSRAIEPVPASCTRADSIPSLRI